MCTFSYWTLLSNCIVVHDIVSHIIVFSFRHTFENLNVSERFLLVVTKIDRLELRLRTMIFKRRFKDEIHELVPQLRCIQGISEKVRTSKRFRRVIEYVLLVGNKMNAGK